MQCAADVLDLLGGGLPVWIEHRSALALAVVAGAVGVVGIENGTDLVDVFEFPCCSSSRRAGDRADRPK
jgi:hypothetical protein